MSTYKRSSVSEKVVFVCLEDVLEACCLASQQKFKNERRTQTLSHRAKLRWDLDEAGVDIDHEEEQDAQSDDRQSCHGKLEGGDNGDSDNCGLM